MSDRARLRSLQVAHDLQVLFNEKNAALAEKKKDDEVVDLLHLKKNEAEKANSNLAEQNKRLMAELEAKERNIQDLTLHLNQTEEENTGLRLKVSKMYSEEHYQAMINFSYVYAFVDVV